MSWLITNLIAAFLLPPLNLLLLAIAGLLLWQKRPHIARLLLVASISLLWLLSTPFFSMMLLHTLEGAPHALGTNQDRAEAIVVLGGGTYFNAPEYGEDTVSEASLARLRYAAKLQRETGKPILVSGGSPHGNSLSEGQQMKQVLEQDFKTPVQWVEDRSDNTQQSAQLSYAQLNPAGIKHIYLVTHAWHMPRSVAVFERAGFDVIPAPTRYSTRFQINLLSFQPDADALRDSRIFMHEMIGMLWYRLKS
jgi:uncharacterized SAM-binding protein YcdF (DUF218 family)